MNATPYYDRDGITIWHADCRDILPSIDPASVGLLLTDPPYGMDLDPDFTGWNGGGRKWAKVQGDAEPFDPSHLLPFGRCVLWGANRYVTRLPPGGKWIIWHKPDLAAFMSDAEMAWHNLSGKSVSMFVKPWASRQSHEPRLHPTQKPVELMTWTLDRWTKPGDLILDPYMGSGPIARAAQLLGRRYIGIELVETYCQAAVNRLAQPSMFTDPALSRYVCEADSAQ